ncbi:MAG: alkaline phosphatase family protein [Clostridia bacterium]|nr:alkaline phosphatase family protein [Clostridia bacterium]
MEETYFEDSLDTLCAALCAVMGIPAPAQAAAPNKTLTEYAEKVFSGRHADRIFMYNPDAVAAWIADKYPQFMAEVPTETSVNVPMRTVMPSVTPVCFGTMYTGAQPEVHGIRRYAKPVIRIDTIFDALLRAGKRCAIVADTECSMGKIFLERDMTYFHFETFSEVNAKAAELIMKDEYDFIAVYNGNYDATMHKNGPEAPISLAALRQNACAYAAFREMIRNNWGAHDTLIGFAMDHGCHEIDGGCGSHGLDMPEDLNIRHIYEGIAKH